MKRARTNWRNLPPKKMISAKRMSDAEQKRIYPEIEDGKTALMVGGLALDGKEAARLVFRGFMDAFFGHSVEQRCDVYEHTYTLKPMDEPFQVTVANEAVPEERRYKAMFPPRHELELEMKVSDVDVSFALYNQLIVREPESYIDLGTLA